MIEFWIMQSTTLLCYVYWQIAKYLPGFLQLRFPASINSQKHVFAVLLPLVVLSVFWLSNYIFLSLIVCAYLGDVINSFVKRTLRIKPSKSFLFFDQTCDIIACIPILLLFYSWSYIFFLLFFGFLLHLVFNYACHLLGYRAEAL